MSVQNLSTDELIDLNSSIVSMLDDMTTSRVSFTLLRRVRSALSMLITIRLGSRRARQEALTRADLDSLINAMGRPVGDNDTRLVQKLEAMRRLLGPDDVMVWSPEPKSTSPAITSSMRRGSRSTAPASPGTSASQRTACTTTRRSSGETSARARHTGASHEEGVARRLSQRPADRASLRQRKRHLCLPSRIERASALTNAVGRSEVSRLRS